MMKKTLYFTILFLIVAMFSVSAATYTSYEQLGENAGTFDRGDSQWNSAMTTYYRYPASLNNGGFIPIISDVNNDTVPDMIAWDNGNIKIFNDAATLKGILNTGSATASVEMAVTDIDGDGLKNIVVMNNFARTITIYNVSSTYGITQWVQYGSILGEGVSQLKCGISSECVVVTSEWQTSTGFPVGLSCPSFPSSDSEPVDMWVYVVNSTAAVSTDVGSQFSSYCSMNSKSYQKHLCFPRVREVQYENYNNDPNGNAYIFSGIEYSESYVIGNNYNAGTDADEKWHIYYVRINPSTKAATLSRHLSYGLGNLMSTQSTGKSCAATSQTSTYGLLGNDLATSPLVGKFQTQGQITFDTAIGYKNALDEFKINTYDSAGVTESSAYISQHPSVQNFHGRFLSNPVLASAFPEGKSGTGDNQNVDVCVMGLYTSDHAIDIGCASEQGQMLVNFIYNLHAIDYLWQLPAAQANLTPSMDVANMAIHSLRSNGETINGKNLNEILTTFGVFKLDAYTDTDFTAPVHSWACTGIAGAGECTATQIFAAPVNYLAWTTADTQDSGWEDLIGLNTNGFWYVDDGYANQPPYAFCPSSGACSPWVLNPCQTSPWQQGTNVVLQVTPSDPESFDLVRARARLYYGTIYEQDSNWTAWKANDGTPIPFTWGNVTPPISAGTLYIEIQDSGSMDIVTNSVGFSVVASGGVETYDCTGGSSTVLPPGGIPGANGTIPGCTGTGCSLTPDQGNNAITNALITANAALGGGLGITTIWLFIMAAVGIALFWHSVTNNKFEGKSTLTAIGLLEGLLLVIGTYLGIMPVGIIIVIAIMFIVVAGMFVRHWIMGTG